MHGTQESRHLILHAIFQTHDVALGVSGLLSKDPASHQKVTETHAELLVKKFARHTLHKMGSIQSLFGSQDRQSQSHIEEVKQLHAEAFTSGHLTRIQSGLVNSTLSKLRRMHDFCNVFITSEKCNGLKSHNDGRLGCCYHLCVNLYGKYECVGGITNAQEHFLLHL